MACGSEGAATASNYEILGVDEHASHELIKRHFLELSLRFQHERVAAEGSPRLVERATFRQQEIDRAWAVLRSPGDRARYDEELRASRAARAPVARRIGGHGGGDLDDLPVLEVLDVLEPAGDGGAPIADPRARSKRWRFFGG